MSRKSREKRERRQKEAKRKEKSYKKPTALGSRSIGDKLGEYMEGRVGKDPESPEFKQEEPGVFTSDKGYGPDELRNKLPEILSGVNEAVGAAAVNAQNSYGASAYVGTAGVRLKSGYRPFFPVIEITAEGALLSVPSRVGVSFDHPINGKASHLRVYDWDNPTVCLYVGSIDADKQAAGSELFQELAKVWNTWFLRIAVGVVNDSQDRRNATYHNQLGFEPYIGQVYQDYVVNFVTGEVDELSTVPIHEMVTYFSTVFSTNKQKDDVILELAQMNGATPESPAMADEFLRIAEQRYLTMEKLVGKPPWKLVGEGEDVDFQKSQHRHIIDNYLHILGVLRSLTTGQHPTDADGLARQRQLWGWMRNARIYEFSKEAYYRLHHSADVYTTEVLRGIEWKSTKVITADDIEDSKTYTNDLIEHGKLVPFPPDLPFEVCYFGWGLGVSSYRLIHLNDFVTYDVDFEPGDSVKESQLLGHIVTRTGWVYGCYAYSTHKGESNLRMRMECNPEEGWAYPDTLVPWIILTTVREIEDHVTVVKGFADGRMRRSFNRFNKQLRLKRNPLIPADYYTVYLRDKLVRETVRRTMESGKSSSPGYAVEVESHCRLKYCRGKYGDPIDEKELERRMRLDYLIFKCGDQIPADLYEMMRRRSLPPPFHGEWISLKKIRVEEHWSPSSPELPRIKGVRKTTKGITSGK